MPTILVWRLGALGDTLLTLPALAAVRARFPDHRVVAAGNPAALEPARWDGLVDQVLDAAAPCLAALSAGAAPAPGVLPDVLDLAIVWSAHHAEIGRGLSRAGVTRIIAAPAVPTHPIAVSTYYLTTLTALGVEPAPVVLNPPPEAVEAVRGIWADAVGDAHRPTVLLHPGAGSKLKRWPLAGYLDLARSLRAGGVTVVWTAGPADEDLRAELALAGDDSRLLPSRGVASLAAYLARAVVVVSGDCGVAHLAALLGIPTVTLFGPTDHRVWAPPGERGVVLQLALSCSPCGALAGRCPSRVCLRSLPCSAVEAAVWTIVHRRARPAPVTRAGTGQDPALSGPAVRHPPGPAPGPPAPLRASYWANGRTWGSGLPSGVI